MTKYFLAGLILILAVGVGFWAGQKQLPINIDTNPVSERKPLYYRHPMNPQVTSPTPAKDEMGMDYVAVYAEPSNTPNLESKSGKILYYRHPMGAADTSPVPKKDEMGMDYLPVYEGEQANSEQVLISPEKIQKLGVKTAIATNRTLTRSIRALV